MLSIFKKKAGVFPIESSWVLYQGQNDGKPMFVRRNDSAKQLKAKSNFNFIIGIAIPLVNPSADGFPQGDEAVLFGQIEDELISQLEKDHTAIVT